MLLFASLYQKRQSQNSPSGHILICLYKQR
jgi:hypothetical protein